MHWISVLLFIASSIATPACAGAIKNAIRTSSMQVISFQEMIDEISDLNAVFIGEQHTNMVHHKAQEQIINALSERDAPVTVAIEMLPSNSQDMLDKWTSGGLTESAFKNIFTRYWDMPWPLYRGIFIYARDNGVPMLGLNVPHSVTSRVARKGIEALSQDIVQSLPENITCDDIDDSYLKFITSAYDTHSAHRGELQYFCEAQKVWDKTMAWNLMDYLDMNQGALAVVIAGSGHSWKGGIPSYVRDYSDYEYAVLIPSSSPPSGTDTLSGNEADYILIME